MPRPGSDHEDMAAERRRGANRADRRPRGGRGRRRPGGRPGPADGRARRDARAGPAAPGRLRELQEADDPAADRARRAGHGRSARAAPPGARLRSSRARRSSRPTTGDSVRKGVELVYAELLGVLEKAGLERIDAEGKPFDPNEHEAVLQEDGDGEPIVARHPPHRLPAQGARAAPGHGEGSEIARWHRSANGSTRTTTPCSAWRQGATEKDDHARLPQARQAVPPRREPGEPRRRGAFKEVSAANDVLVGRRRSARSTTRSGAWSRRARTRRPGVPGRRSGSTPAPAASRSRRASTSRDLLGGLFGGGGAQGGRGFGRGRGGRGRNARHAPQRGADLETELHLDFLDAVHGHDDLRVVHGRGRVLGVQRQRRASRARCRRRARVRRVRADRGRPGPVLVLAGVPDVRRARHDHRDPVPPLPRQRRRGPAAAT